MPQIFGPVTGLLGFLLLSGKAATLRLLCAICCAVHIVLWSVDSASGCVWGVDSCTVVGLVRTVAVAAARVVYICFARGTL